MDSKIRSQVFDVLEKGGLTGNNSLLGCHIVKTASMQGGCEDFLIMTDEIVDLMITYIEANSIGYKLCHMGGVKSIFVDMSPEETKEQILERGYPKYIWDDFTWNDTDRHRSVAIAEACVYTKKNKI